ncbi:MAG: response regulator [Bacteroidales bacterium]
MEYSWPNKKILIAEDSEMNFILLKKNLENSGAAIIWARDGLEMLNSVLTLTDIDLILMDINMPRMDGYTVTRKIRQAGINTPIIAQSAFLLEDEKDKILEVGCNDFLEKPINKDQLLEKIDFFLV